MQYPSLKKLSGLLACAAVALVLIGCKGADGQNGTNGTNGTNGGPGTPGAGYAQDITTFTPEEWSQLTLKGDVTSVSITGTAAPVVKFTLTDGHGVPLRGLANFISTPAGASYSNFPNLGLSIAKLVPGTSGSPDRWVNYIVTSPSGTTTVTWTLSTPGTDNIGTLTEPLNDGNYVYTFRRDMALAAATKTAFTDTATKFKADVDEVTYDPSLVHRITLYVGGLARGTGISGVDRGINTLSGAGTTPGVYVLNPLNKYFDFIPQTGLKVATSGREVTSVDTCFTCHAKFEFHAGGRQDTAYCVVCHTDQRKFGKAEATTGTTTTYTGDTSRVGGMAQGNFVTLAHKVHMGEELTNTGYNYAGVLFNEVTYPQDHRNCVKCHTNSTKTPQGDNWFNKPSAVACGACHDKVDFKNGVNHSVQLNDQNCSSTGCHTPAIIKLAHMPIVAANTGSAWHTAGGNSNTNTSAVAAFTNNLPTGARRITWDLKKFTLDVISPAVTAQPVFIFRFLDNSTTPATPIVFNTYDPAGAADQEMITGFMGGPSFYVAYTVPQDGINSPADWNATASTYLKNIWRGDNKDNGGNALAVASQGTLTYNSSGTNAGYYTLVMTGAKVPTTATIITGGIGYTYGVGSATPSSGLPWAGTLPLVQTDLAAFPVSQSPTNPNLWAKIGGLAVPAPNVARIVDALPTGFPSFTTSDLTKGPANTARRVIVSNQKCNDCHGALGVFTNKVYHAGQRNDANTCEFCHNGQRVNNGWGVNTKDFVHAIHGASKRANKFSWEASAGDTYWKVTYPSVLNNCEACHVPGSYDFGTPNNASAVPNLLWTTVATGTTPSPMNVVITGNETIPGTYWSQFSYDAAVAGNAAKTPAVVGPSGYAFGSGFSFNASTGATTVAAGTTLVSSPYVAACSNCHDSKLAIAHMQSNGGSFYAARSTVQTAGTYVKQEQCFVCHSTGKIADTQKVHMNFK